MPGSPIWPNAKKLRLLDLRGCLITDAGLAHLAPLTGLGALKLRLPALPMQVSSHLEGMKKLRGLALEDTSVTDAGLAHLSGLTELDDLDLMRVHISDEGLAHLKNLTKLRILFLRATFISGDGLENLREHEATAQARFERDAGQQRRPGKPGWHA